MAVTIELPPDLEVGFREQAMASGLELQDYVLRLLLSQRTQPRQSPLTPAAKAALWRAGIARLPLTPPLSGEAISRRSIYEGRGE